MKKEEIIIEAQSVLEKHREVEEVFSTEDGNIFYKKAHADIHRSRIGGEVITHIQPRKEKARVKVKTTDLVHPHFGAAVKYGKTAEKDTDVKDKNPETDAPPQSESESSADTGSKADDAPAGAEEHPAPDPQKRVGKKNKKATSKQVNKNNK